MSNEKKRKLEKIRRKLEEDEAASTTAKRDGTHHNAQNKSRQVTNASGTADGSQQHPEDHGDKENDNHLEVSVQS